MSVPTHVPCTGPLRGLNPGPPAPEAGIIPLDQADDRPVTFGQIYKSRSVTLSLIIIKHFHLAAKLKENKCLLSIYIISPHPILPSENYPCPYLIQHIYNGTYILKFIQ